MAALRGAGPAPAAPPVEEEPRTPRCAPDAAEAAARCAGWAQRGECVFNQRYMRQHCAESCARVEIGEGRSAECEPSTDGVSTPGAGDGLRARARARAKIEV